MPEKAKKAARPIPDWAKKFRRPGVEIRWIGQGLYAYEKKSKWIPALKDSRKTTVAYLGRVTRDGIQAKRQAPRMAASILDHGNVRLLNWALGRAKEAVRAHFGDDADTLLASAVLRAAYTAPLKRLEFHYETSTAKEFYPEADVERNAMTKLIRRVGNNGQAQMGVYRALASDVAHAAIDLTQIVSASENVNLVEPGYNAHGGFPDQVQLLMVHGVGGADPRPAFLKLLPGSIRDAPTLKNAVFEAGLKDVTLVGDKGWLSEENLAWLEVEGLHYVMALRRNHAETTYLSSDAYPGEFAWRDRIIWWGERTWGQRRVFVFLNKSLMVEEEKNFLALVHEGKRTRQEFDDARHRFGTLTLVTNADVTAEQAYSLYKQRGEVEQAFDSFKNALDWDRSYMQDTDAWRGYYFIAFLSLYAFTGILNQLRAAKLVDKYSVEDVLRYTAKIHVVTDGTKQRPSEIPRKVADLLAKLGLDGT